MANAVAATTVRMVVRGTLFGCAALVDMRTSLHARDRSCWRVLRTVDADEPTIDSRAVGVLSSIVGGQGLRMQPSDHHLPWLLRELHQLEFDYAGGSGIDFEPYRAFLSQDETRAWFRAWTGNPSVEGQEYRVFGQDGTGGLVAFWCCDPKSDLLRQPIVFFGSEGALGVVACDFRDYVCLLAAGVGPMEAIEYPDAERVPQPALAAFAARHMPDHHATPAEILARAQKAFPDFQATVRALTR